MKNGKNKFVKIVDEIYPLTKLKSGIYPIYDHINLTGTNPLKGPQFISLSDVYFRKNNNSILVACLKVGTKPNRHEISKLKKIGVKAYCHNLASKVILAASYGLKVKAFGILK